MGVNDSMKSSFEKKSLAVVIIVLFFGISIIPSMVAERPVLIETDNTEDPWDGIQEHGCSIYFKELIENINESVHGSKSQYDFVQVQGNIDLNKTVEFDPEPYTAPFFSIYRIKEYGSSTYGLTSADFNNDNQLDFAVCWKTSPWEYAGISIFYNMGNGEFDEVLIKKIPYALFDIESGDYDNDGDIDFLFTYNEAMGASNVNGTVNILWNDNGSFEKWNQVAWLGPDSPVHHEKWINLKLSSADFDLDGDLDFITSGNCGKVKLYKNDGGGNFTSEGFIYDFGSAGRGLSSADFNNDGLIDFIVATEETQGDIITGRGHVYLKLNTGSDSCFDHTMGEIIADLPPKTNWTIGSLPFGSLSVLDYNDDGVLDFFYGSYKAYLFINKNDVFQPLPHQDKTLFFEEVPTLRPPPLYHPMQFSDQDTEAPSFSHRKYTKPGLPAPLYIPRFDC